MSTYPTRLAKPDSIRSALKTYRVLAVAAGIALFILVLEIVMKYVFHLTNVLTEYWSPIHGLIYFAYAVSIVNLGLKCRWPIVRIILNLLSGFVPLVPFVAERRVTASTEALLSRAYFAGAPASGAAAEPSGDAPTAG